MSDYNTANRLAAEAIVDAALCVKREGAEVEVGTDTDGTDAKMRERLIEAVLKDPTFTAVLFSKCELSSQVH